MKHILKLVSASLLSVYVGDLLLKKLFLDGFYANYALPETAAYLCLFFAVGAFLMSIVRLDDGDER